MLNTTGSILLYSAQRLSTVADSFVLTLLQRIILGELLTIRSFSSAIENILYFREFFVDTASQGL